MNGEYFSVLCLYFHLRIRVAGSPLQKRFWSGSEQGFQHRVRGGAVHALTNLSKSCLMSISFLTFQIFTYQIIWRSLRWMVDWINEVECHLFGDRPLATSQIVYVPLGEGKLLGDCAIYTRWPWDDWIICFLFLFLEPELEQRQQWTLDLTRCLQVPQAGPTLKMGFTNFFSEYFSKQLTQVSPV